MWSFGADNGYQGLSDKDFAWDAVAVHPGDVTAVSEPQTLALALLALGATVVARRRRPTWGSALSAAQG